MARHMLTSVLHQIKINFCNYLNLLGQLKAEIALLQHMKSMQRLQMNEKVEMLARLKAS